MKKSYFELVCISALWLGIPVLINAMKSREILDLSESILVIAGYIFGGLISLLAHLGLNGRQERVYQCGGNVSWQKITCAFLTYLFLIIGLIILSPQTQLKAPYLIKIVVTNFAVIGLIEELIFRGVLLNKALLLMKNKYVAIIAVSTVFSGAHLMFMIAADENTLSLMFMKFASSFILSLFLCWEYLKSKSLVICIIFHAGQNIIANLAFINPTLGLTFFALGYLLIFIIINRRSNITVKSKNIEPSKTDNYRRLS
jgi:membrane protease YdiL (CAAX protease family)